jgi:nicotinamidase-related amidase
MGNLKAVLGPGAVHLCIDMQRLFAEGGPWPTPWMKRVLPNVVRVVEHEPARTLFTRFIPPRSPDEAAGMWRAYYRKWSKVTRDSMDTSLIDLVPVLQRYVPPSEVFDRMQYSTFACGRLHPFLRERGIDTVIVTGSETDICVLSSVLSAVDLGYRVIVACDAICSSSDESHDALLDLYRRRFDLQIELAEVSEILETWTTGE